MNTRQKRLATRIHVCDFFSGAGGASRGFQDAGMEIALALDRDLDACSTFQTNFPAATFISANIEEISVGSIAEQVNKFRPNPVLFCGCAPCQPFTHQNTSRPSERDDGRVPLLDIFGRFVERCLPDLVFVENVRGIQHCDRRRGPLGRFLQRLDGCDYQHTEEPVALAKYGVPQSRTRFVLLASRHGPIGLPPPTHGPRLSQPDYLTVRDAIHDLPPIVAGEQHPVDPCHRAAGLSPINLRRVRNTPEGGGHTDWPDPLRLDCHRRGGFTDVYGRMAWDRPASCLTTKCHSLSNGRYGHPEQDRAISIREAARLQTFPDDFTFSGTLTSLARQIGNAVPARFTRLVGEHMLQHLTQHGVLSTP